MRENKVAKRIKNCINISIVLSSILIFILFICGVNYAQDNNAILSVLVVVAISIFSIILFAVMMYGYVEIINILHNINLKVSKISTDKKENK